MIAVVPAAVLLGACSSSSTAGTGATFAKTSSGASSATAPAPTSANDGATLGKLLQAGVANVHSAHVAITLSLSGQTVAGSGVEQLTNSKLTAMDLSEKVSGLTLRIIVIGNKAYAKLPPALNTSGKPYVLLSTTSKNATIRQLASGLQSSLSSASVGDVSALAAAATSVKNTGKATVDGTATTRYSVLVDVAKLPDSLAGKQALESSGLTTIPVVVYVDGQGRPAEVTEQIKISGQTVSTKVFISHYNEPVHISAPPANQVGNE